MRFSSNFFFPIFFYHEIEFFQENGDKIIHSEMFIGNGGIKFPTVSQAISEQPIITHRSAHETSHYYRSHAVSKGGQTSHKDDK
jgi:hypothetical protein